MGGALSTRLVRFLFAFGFGFAVMSPAGVVFAVVWTAPPVATVASQALPVAEAQPARMLPAPDVQPTSLPPPDFNVYANTLSGVVPCPLCELPPRVYVPNSMSGTVDVIDPLTFTVIDHYAVGAIPTTLPPRGT